MRILLVHNFYGSAAPSGENQVFEAEKALLQSRGHEVAEFTRHSDEIRGPGVWGSIKGAAATRWNPWAAQAIRRAVARFLPDVVHVHNTFPLISPSIFHALAGMGVARVLTLPLAVNVALHRAAGTWSHQVDAFIALTEFQRQRMVDAGLPASRVFGKPNFYPGNPVVVPWAQRQPYVVFAGRLTAEKGVATLVRAWQLWGPEAPELRVQQQIAQASLLLLPSEWFEGFPMVVQEAFAFGTPAAVSDLGPLPSIVRHGVNGLVFEARNPAALLREVRSSWSTPSLLSALGHGARAAFEANYTEESNYQAISER